jgi:hypothetical protein
MKTQLYSYIEKNFPQYLELLLEHAQRELRQCFQFSMPWDMENTWISHTFENEINWNFQMYDDPEWTFMLSRNAFVLRLAQAFVLTGNKSYAKKAMEYITDFLINAEYNPSLENTSWRSLDAGMRIMHWIDAMTLLEAEQEPWFREGVAMHLQYLVSKDSSFLHFSNWGIIQNAGLFKASLLLKNKDTALLAQKRIVQSLIVQILPDGMQWEQSPLYQAEILSALLSMIRDAKQVRWTLDSTIITTARSMALYMLGSIKPNRHQFLQSDSDDTDIRDILTRASFLLEERELDICCYPVLEPYSCFFAKEKELIAFNTRKTQQPTFVSFGGMESGNIYLRTGWDRYDSCCHFRCGPLGGGHGHADLLHIDVVSHGQDILVDSGRYTYCNTEPRLLLKSSKNHSTLIVDGKEATKPTGTWSYEKLGLCGSRIMKEFDNWSYAQGCSYSYVLDQPNPVFHEREILVLGKSLLLIHDTLLCNASHDYTWYFQFSNEGLVTLEHHKVIFETGRLTSFLLHPMSKSSIESSYYSPHYNQLHNKNTVELKTIQKGSYSALFVLFTKEKNKTCSCSIDEVPVFGHRSGVRVNSKDARSWIINTDNEKPIHIIARYRDSMEMLTNGTFTTYARLGVMQDTKVGLFRF